MDPLNWLLVTWLGISALIFVFFNKLAEYWPSIQRWQNRGKEQRRKSSVEGSYYKKSVCSTNDQDLPEMRFVPADVSSTGVEITHSALTGKPPFPPEIRVTRTPSQQSTRRPTNLPLQNESVEWLNQFLAWFMCHYKGRLGFLDAWVRALNEAAKKVTTQFDYEVVFDEIRVIDDKTVPRFANFKSDKGPRETLSIRGNFKLPAVLLNFTATRKLNDKTLISSHIAELSDLSSKVHIRLVCMDCELFCMMCFDGSPTVDIELQQTSITRIPDRVDNASLERILRKCLTGAIVNMTFLEEEKVLSRSEERTPSPTPAPSPSAVQCANELLRRLSCPPPPEPTPDWQQRPSSLTEQYNRLLVKILRAESLQQINSFTQPYVVVELDEPPQRHTTALGSSTSPVWEEHFLFDIDHQKSQELLFEVYGRASAFVDPHDSTGTQQKFLGLAIISIDEIKRSPVTRHELSLQPRPFIKDLVSGTLFVECLFVYASSQDHDDEFLLQEFEMHMKHHGGHITTAYANRDADLLVLKIPAELETTVGRTPEGTLPPTTGKTRKKLKLSPKSASASASPIPSSKSPQTLDARGRRATKPSFFDDLKRKMSFRHHQRPKSCEPDTRQILSPTDFTYHPPRSTSSTTSVERPPSSQTEVGPGCSELEDMDVDTTEAAHLRSALVVELLENQMKKYCYIPNELVSTKKAKEMIKAGKKLHIFDNHTFVAVKVPSNTTCKVCGKALASTFRKQGYQCRDCRIICHKRCYTKVAHLNCPNSHLPTLDIQRLNA